MKVRVGSDIVYIPEFIRAMKTGGQPFLTRIFLKSELDRGTDPMHLAGIFAAKESVVKALSFPGGSWQNIQILNQKNGRPAAQIPDYKKKIISSDLSISHSKDYAIAVFVAVF